MKLPFFPRKALESDLDLYQGGELGKVNMKSIYFSRYLLSKFYFCTGIAWIRRAAQIYVGSFDSAYV